MSKLPDQLVIAIRAEAARLKVEVATLLAVAEVESGLVFFAAVDGRNEPLIRWEGHYFDRRLKGPAREEARRLGLAHPTAGKIKNPKSQAARYAMLARAFEIDAAAAVESCSWGFGQVMGAHWSRLKYSSAEDLMNRARSGVVGQLELMICYIERAGLVGALQRRDWAAFARGYNGPAYRKNRYDTKLAAAYARHAASLPITDSADLKLSAAGMLRLGSRGARVRELQHLLTRAGYPLKVDGDYGPATHDAIREFQQFGGLEVDGVAGPQTMRALEMFRQGAADRPGEIRTADVPEVRDGLAGGIGGGVTVEVARQQIETAADRLAYVPGVEWLSTGLGVIAAVLVIGGLGYAAYGWWRSRQTEETPSATELSDVDLLEMFD